MKTIVMTGGTSGFGGLAVNNILKQPETKLILGARSMRVKNEKNLTSLHLDLAKLESVRQFASEVLSGLGNNRIDSLVLNAGLQLAGGTKTQDGFETTFAVNYLSHYLLLRLLTPGLAYDANIVMTTSGTYDPAEKTIIPPPRHANAKYLAYPETDPEYDKDMGIAGGRAYSSSKLCVLLMARYLNGHPELINGSKNVIAYDPGPTPGTGLVRNNNVFIRMIWNLLGFPVFSFLFRDMNSRNSSGRTLSDLSLGKINIPEGCFYAALRRGKIVFPELSDLAKRDDLADKLWTESALLAGLKN